MTDSKHHDLRTRIAAVLMDTLCAEIDKLGQYWNRYTPLDDNGEPTSGMWLGIDGSVDVNALADAVIRELNLHEENGWFGPTNIPKHRYVTDWIPDE